MNERSFSIYLRLYQKEKGIKIFQKIFVIFFVKEKEKDLQPVRIANPKSKKYGGEDRSRTCMPFRTTIFKTVALPLCDLSKKPDALPRREFPERNEGHYKHGKAHYTHSNLLCHS